MRCRVIEFDTIDSTNSEAMRRAARGERGPVWIRADPQQLGRGRSGRQWSSPPGNLAATLLFDPGCPPDKLHQLSLIAGVAVCDALGVYLDARKATPGIRLKWPNDVMIDDAKVCGILVESSVFGDRSVAVIGIGCNLGYSPQIEDRSVTCLADHVARSPSPSAFLEHLSLALERWLAIWDAGRSFADVRDAWLGRAYPIGARISVRTGSERVEGGFAGLGEDGALLLEESTGNLRTFHFGDVAVGGGAAKPDTRGQTKN